MRVCVCFLTCCSEPISTLSMVAVMAGLMADTMAATSICRVHTTG